MKHDKQFDEMLMLYFYKELSSAERQIFKNHIEECSHCQYELNKLKEMKFAISKATEAVPTEELIKRANLRVLDEIGFGSKSAVLLNVKVKIEEMLDSLTFIFSRPKYQLIAVALTFVVGVFIGKMWLSSGLLNDPEMLANFISHKPRMSETEENILKKALADYVLHSGDVEISDLIQKQGVENMDGIVSVNVRIKKDFELVGGLDDPTIQNMLRYSALHDGNPDRRLRAVKLLSKSVQNREIESTIIAVLLQDEIVDVRLRAIQSLCKQECSEQILDAIESVVLRDSSVRVRKLAIEYLSNVNKEEIIPVIALVSANDKDETVRSLAREILEDLRNKFFEDNERGE